MRIAVVGDLLLDYWYQGTIVKAEYGSPVYRASTPYITLGGSGLVATLLNDLGGDVEPYLFAYADRAAQTLLDDIGFLSQTTPTELTPQKHRLIDKNLMLSRWDIETIAEHPSERLLFDLFREQVETFDLVILSDYGKGCFAGEVSQKYLVACRKAKTPVVVDPKYDLIKWRGCDVLKCNQHEALGVNPLELNCRAYIRTSGAGGCYVQLRGEKGKHLKPEKVTPGYTLGHIGAGDCFCAAFAVEWLRTRRTMQAAQYATNKAAEYVAGNNYIPV